MDVSGMGSVLERRREPASEQSADYVCAWASGAQEEDRSNYKTYPIIVC